MCHKQAINFFMMAFSSNAPASCSLRMALADRLRDDILNACPALSWPLCSHSLAKQWGVAPDALRDALHILVAQGLLLPQADGTYGVLVPSAQEVQEARAWLQCLHQQWQPYLSETTSSDSLSKCILRLVQMRLALSQHYG